MRLIIVESPTKAKTISHFLAKTDIVESSFGHVRDLPTKKLGVDINNNFEPEYEVPAKAKKVAAKLKSLVKKADGVILATDEDREGEAIAWHLQQLLKLPAKQKIIVFRITNQPLKMPNARADYNLINANVEDMMISWHELLLLMEKSKIYQPEHTVTAIRLIVEREKEIEAFIKQNIGQLAPLQAHKNLLLN